MAVPIIFFYGLGFILFLIATGSLSKEANRLTINDIVVGGMAMLANTMAYYLSYSDVDYTSAAYFPLVLLILSVVFCLYIGFKMLPEVDSWDMPDTNNEDFY